MGISLSFPQWFISLCADYHSGQHSMMYAVSSTGALALGSEGYRRGRNDEEWLGDLLVDLHDEFNRVLCDDFAHEDDRSDLQRAYDICENHLFDMGRL